MTDYTNLQTRCQRGEGRIADANNLLAECYGALGKLIAENQRLEREQKNDAIAYKAAIERQNELRAENAGLHTGYQAYELVNAELKAENGLLRQLASDTGLELRKASSWICREVEAGTKSATHWAVRLREKADHIDAAMGKGEQS